jgi:hypothetical protein
MSFKNFIATIWSARLLEHLDKKHVYVSLFNRDYEGEIKAYGDTVKINQIGNVTIKDYDGSDIESPEDLDGTQQLLVIDQSKYFNFRIKDIDNAQSNPKLMDKAMQRAGYGLSDVDDMFAANLMAVSVAAANIIGTVEAPITPTKTTAYDYLVDLGTKLTEANAPMAGRKVVLPAWYHGLLLKDDRFVGNGTDVNVAILEGGVVGTGAGFEIFVSNNVPNVNGEKYKIIASVEEQGTWADQIVETEPYRQEKNFSDAVKGLHVYGAKVTNPTCIAMAICNKN